MGLKKYIQKYKSYEATELARRAEKKKKLKAYIFLKKKKVIVKKSRKFNPKSYSKVIGNPYGVKFPKPAVRKKIKKRRKKVKTVIIYK